MVNIHFDRQRNQERPMSELVDPRGVQSGSSVSRREFVRTVGAAAIAATVPALGARKVLGAQVGPTPSAPAETLVARFYKTLTDEQKKIHCFPFSHPKRSQVNNNWAIVEPRIEDFTKEQQALCRDIFKNLTSEDGFDRFMRQMEEDDGGFERYHVAVFGEPGSNAPFEWVITGRHVTMRADGNSVEGAAFGGPVFYGHASHNFNEDAKHTDNVWWYQGEQANKIFRTLDDKQQKQALVEIAEPDAPRSIELKGAKLGEPGLAVRGLDGQQKAMVRDLVEMMLRPYRSVDAAEVRECLEAEGGVDPLRLTYFKQGDIGNDGVWDIWKLEGPAFSWYFHGSPHVHTWLNVARKT
jgi:hypothetical protein